MENKKDSYKLRYIYGHNSETLGLRIYYTGVCVWQAWGSDAEKKENQQLLDLEIRSWMTACL